MTNIRYIEDLFIAMIDLVNAKGLNMQYQDRSAAHSFYTSIQSGKSMTEKQGSYVLRLLTKYRNICKPYMDYEQFLEEPIWKNSFRVIDNSKKVWIETFENNMICIALKFPFSFKDTFDSEFSSWEKYTVWDRERKVRILALHEHNIIHVHEFCKEHNFEFDQSFLEVHEKVEHIWDYANRYMPFVRKVKGELTLFNASESLENYWNNNKTDDYESNLILAKNLGLIYGGEATSIIEKIAFHQENKFHIKNFEDVIQIAEKSPKKVAILLDRTSNYLEWLRELNSTLTRLGKDKTDWRICFRKSNKDDPNFNKWIKENDFGGKTDTAKYLIFLHTPHKWLFKKENDVTMLITNGIVPQTTTTTRNMLRYHPLVIHVGNVSPTVHKREKIVEL